MSTRNAIITSVEKVARALDTGKIVVGVYLDIRKTFDDITQSILLRKIYALRIPSNIYDLVNPIRYQSTTNLLHKYQLSFSWVSC